jgi:hypothetical protein
MAAPFSGVLIGLCNNNWFNTVNSLNIVYNFYPTGGRTCGAGMVLLYDTEAGLMGRRVDVEFIFSEFEWQVIQALDIDIVEICRKSIKNEIRDRAETREFIYKQQNTVIENENLLNELERLRKQLPTVDDHAFWATIKKPTIKKPPIKKSSIKK